MKFVHLEFVQLEKHNISYYHSNLSHSPMWLPDSFPTAQTTHLQQPHNPTAQLNVFVPLYPDSLHVLTTQPELAHVHLPHSRICPHVPTQYPMSRSFTAQYGSLVSTPQPNMAHICLPTTQYNLEQLCTYAKTQYNSEVPTPQFY